MMIRVSTFFALVGTLAAASMVTCMKTHCTDKGLLGCEELLDGK